jgi:hypothetical protein
MHPRISLDGMPRLRELRSLLRAEEPPAGTALITRGASGAIERLRADAQRTARRFSMDGQPLLGVSVFVVLDVPLGELLRTRLSCFRSIYLSTADRFHAFQLLPTFRRPHFIVRLQRADDRELGDLLAALGPSQVNPLYA